MEPTKFPCRGRDGLVAVAGLALPGCRPGPDITVAGSYFPSWMAALVLGVIGTMLCWRFFTRTGLDPYLGPRALVYPSDQGLGIEVHAVTHVHDHDLLAARRELSRAPFQQVETKVQLLDASVNLAFSTGEGAPASRPRPDR